jgi:hypothetical protein
MSTYRVNIRRLILQTADIEIEADDEAKARESVEDYGFDAADGDLDWDSSVEDFEVSQIVNLSDDDGYVEDENSTGVAVGFSPA